MFRNGQSFLSGIQYKRLLFPAAYRDFRSTATSRPERLKVFDRICSGTADGGPIASMDIPERFRWLTAVRSSSIQTSRPHPGFSTDLEVTFEKLFAELVL